MGEAYEKALAAREASVGLRCAPAGVRDAALAAMADALERHADDILAENGRDMDAARSAGTPGPLLDRLMLDAGRIESIAAALRELAEQPDVLGEVVEGRRLYNDIQLTKLRVPLGVVAMVYEARPNVTADAAGLCVKTGNACVLRGGSLAQRSCSAIARVLAQAAQGAGLPAGCINYIEDAGHDATDELMGLSGLVDVLIPRGSGKLIQHCVRNAKVPVIETGEGNCHVYLHEAANPEFTVPIVVNAKTQRPGVCNAVESLLVDEHAAEALLPDVLAALAARGVTVHADAHAARVADACGVEVVPATDEDWGREYLDLEISVKCVSGLDEAIAHINEYGTHHSDCIISNDNAAVMRFLNEVDSAAVYANASTRFSDGGQFGLGAEIGISTQKLHARGPMGAEALTSTKFVLQGTGQVRE